MNSDPATAGSAPLPAEEAGPTISHLVRRVRMFIYDHTFIIDSSGTAEAPKTIAGRLWLP